MEYYPNSWESITREFSEVQIAIKCLDLPKFPCCINSPLREDKKPSFSLYEKDEKVFCKDFSTGDFWHLPDFLCTLYSCSIIDLCDSLSVNTSLEKVSKQHDIYKPKIKNVVIQTRERVWLKIDDEFWGKYGITRKWLKFANVHPVNFMFINGKAYRTDKYAYTYIEHKDGIETQKVYQPFNVNGFKWISSANGSVWSLWTQLPEKGENLIITSSLKDALTIWANTGIPSCSLQSESTMPKEKVVNQLKSRFNNIFVLFDNDFDKKENHGRIFGERVAKRFDLIQIELPTGTAKDPSDYRALSSKENFNKLILKLIEDGIKQRKND